MNPLTKNNPFKSSEPGAQPQPLVGRRQAVGLAGLIFAGLLLLAALTFAGGAVAQSTSTPSEPPDAESGVAIYGERCANCHGQQGLGDGELAADLPNPPTALASADYLRGAVPSEMFDTITNGRVDQGMPPFGPTSSNPLDDAQRWDAIAAIYSLGTPLESVNQGQQVYEENCLACHGAEGLGDGPEAAGLDKTPGDLSSLDYWASRSNQAVFDTLAAGNQITAHEYDLGDDDLWATVDYIRTFSYGYTDALALFRPLASAAISGPIVNGTTGEPPGGELTALLRAFTRDLEITLTMTDTVDAEGQYSFELSDVPQEWFYRVGVTYDGVDFGSDFTQLTYLQPEAELPITVYDKTDDASALSIQQLHMVLTFAEDLLQVGELYVVSNNEPTVFVGQTGNPSEGTFEFAVPEAAENVAVQRGFGSIDSFIPASEVISTADGRADTLPVRPGQATLIMLVQYDLPYGEGVTLSHPLYYNTANVNLVMPDAGVSLKEGDGWFDTGQQAMETGNFISFGQDALTAGSSLTLELEGQPRVTTSSSNAPGSVIQNNATELLIGVGMALVVIVVAAVAIRRWRSGPEEYAYSREELIEAIAELDAEHEAGTIGEEEYQEEREALMDELRAIWEEEDGA